MNARQRRKARRKKQGKIYRRPDEQPRMLESGVMYSKRDIEKDERVRFLIRGKPDLSDERGRWGRWPPWRAGDTKSDKTITLLLMIIALVVIGVAIVLFSIMFK